jgi:NOL1/NOP2/sun family putative RNA methylase
MADAQDQSTDLPPQLQEFERRLEELLGPGQCAQVLDTMRRPKRRGYWVNGLRGAEPDGQAQPLQGLAGFWLLSPDQERGAQLDAQVADGRIYLLNPASLLAVTALAPQHNEELLDLAAAPGGKTLLMAAAMANSGRIAAVEPVKGRFHRLRANLQRCGVTNVDFYLADGRGVGAKVPGRFDGVLLDAPCSSEARIRLNEPKTYAHWKPRKIKEVARKQRGLLRSAFAALKVGGRLVYSTCSFAPEENEANVDYLLSAESGADLVAVDFPAAPVTAGVTQWRSRAFDARVSRCARVQPTELWDGFFVAKFIKRA